MTPDEARRLATRIRESGYLTEHEYAVGERVIGTDTWAVELWLLDAPSPFARLSTPEDWTALATQRGAARTASTAPLYNAVPMDIDLRDPSAFAGTLWPEMTDDRSATTIYRLEQTSAAELADYGETPAYLDTHWGIGARIAHVARLKQGNTVIYACDQHPGASHCEHAQILADVLAARAARRGK